MSIDHDKRLNAKNKDTLWQDTLTKEMYQILVHFKILEKGQSPPPGWKKSSGHIIFDVYMYFMGKTGWVKDSHRTPDHEASSYAAFFSQYSIRIELMTAALQGANVLVSDILNAYLQASSSEKHFIIIGIEFVLEHQGKQAMILQALYWEKVTARDFFHHLGSCMKHLGI